MMKLDSYSIKARYFPAILSIILPVIIMNHFYTSEIFAKFVDNILGAKIISNLTISTISLLFLSQIGRIVGKVFEFQYFRDESDFYTTKYLMYGNKFYPDSYKRKIATLVKKDFGIPLLDVTAEEENPYEAKKLIIVAVRQIRKKLFKNKFLLQHNIEYGFMRNLIGGSVLGIILCGINLYFFEVIEPIQTARIISIILGLIYLFIVLSSKLILKLLSKSYAVILFREYMP